MVIVDGPRYGRPTLHPGGIQRWDVSPGMIKEIRRRTACR